MSQPGCSLIKVGGSLFDLPDLSARLRNLIRGLSSSRIILFPGGGPSADVVRALDRIHKLGEASSHWLALRALSVNAYFLQALLPEFEVSRWPEVGARSILDPFVFARADEQNVGHLPTTWQVTSDSLAARAAIVFGAREMVLLKSMPMNEDMTWFEAARVGLVDAYFPTVVGSLQVRVVNVRAFV
jgi:5-(aminomethyl)-3-furanmethanol phosphate kinase